MSANYLVECGGPMVKCEMYTLLVNNLSVDAVFWWGKISGMKFLYHYDILCIWLVHIDFITCKEC